MSRALAVLLSSFCVMLLMPLGSESLYQPHRQEPRKGACATAGFEYLVMIVGVQESTPQGEVKLRGKEGGLLVCLHFPLPGSPLQGWNLGILDLTPLSDSVFSL